MSGLVGAGLALGAGLLGALGFVVTGAAREIASGRPAAGWRVALAAGLALLVGEIAGGWLLELDDAPAWSAVSHLGVWVGAVVAIGLVSPTVGALGGGAPLCGMVWAGSGLEAWVLWLTEFRWRPAWAKGPAWDVFSLATVLAGLPFVLAWGLGLAFAMIGLPMWNLALGASALGALLGSSPAGWAIAVGVIASASAGAAWLPIAPARARVLAVCFGTAAFALHCEQVGRHWREMMPFPPLDAIPELTHPFHVFLALLGHAFFWLGALDVARVVLREPIVAAVPAST